MRKKRDWALAAITTLTLGCGGSSQKPVSNEIDILWDRGNTSEDEAPSLHSSEYFLTWRGKRIGHARETFHRSKNGVVVRRQEEIRVRREGTPVDSETEIVIYADNNLRATRVELLARAGAVRRKGRAIRAEDGQWVISLEDEKVRKAPADAIPLELIPYVAAQRELQEIRSPVLLAGYGFAVTDMVMTHDGKAGRARLKTQWGDIETVLRMDAQGELLQSDTGFAGSRKVSAGELEKDFVPPELPGASTIAIEGNTIGSTLIIENTNRQPPPPFAGQSVRIHDGGWSVEFDNESPEVSPRIKNLVREVDKLLANASDAPGAGAQDAMSLGRGDCTAHSTLLVDMAAQQGLEARLVTGLRVDGKQLVRHRWVAIKSGDSWVQVDPTFGEAPVARRAHIGLAIHGDSTAEIALVDEAVFQGMDEARARWSTGNAQ